MRRLIHQVSFLLLKLSCVCSLQSQCLLNAYKPLQTPAEELELLPDTASYYQEEEVYSNDSLIHARTIMTMHNYGDIRVAAYNDEYSHAQFDKLVSLRQMDDSLWVQTTEYYYSSGLFTDTLLVWMKKGVVNKAVTQSGGEKTFQYTYNDKGQLIQKKIVDFKNVETICNYVYLEGKLMSMKCGSTPLDSHTISITYTDTLITELDMDLRKGRAYLSKYYYRLDTCGNILTKQGYSKFSDEADYGPTINADYSYFSDGTWQLNASQALTGESWVINHFPNAHYPGFRFVMNGENVERVMRTIWIN